MTVVYKMRCGACPLTVERAFPSTFGDMRKTAMRHLLGVHSLDERQRSLMADRMARDAMLGMLDVAVPP